MKNPNILVATDLSPHSIDIVQKAASLAKKMGVSLHIIHVVEDKLFDFFEHESPILEKAKKAMQEYFPAIANSHLHCTKGKIAQSVVELANKLESKLVVLGKSGENGGLKNLFIGSSTKSIVRSLRVPALVVKSIRDLHVEKILIPTDLSEASRWHIHATKELFPNAKITLLHTFITPFNSRLSLYGVKKGDVNLLGENLATYAQNKAALFMENLGVDKKNVEITVRECGLDANSITGIANMYGIQTISLHTTGSISLFAFDLLLETDKDVIINIV